MLNGRISHTYPIHDAYISVAIGTVKFDIITAMSSAIVFFYAFLTENRHFISFHCNEEETKLVESCMTPEIAKKNEKSKINARNV